MLYPLHSLWINLTLVDHIFLSVFDGEERKARYTGIYMLISIYLPVLMCQDTMVWTPLGVTSSMNGLGCHNSMPEVGHKRTGLPCKDEIYIYLFVHVSIFKSFQQKPYNILYRRQFIAF